MWSFVPTVVITFHRSHTGGEGSPGGGGRRERERGGSRRGGAGQWRGGVSEAGQRFCLRG